ncbi:MAG: hypothetical protein H8K03_12155 [Nitrospira sp.]
MLELSTQRLRQISNAGQLFTRRTATGQRIYLVRDVQLFKAAREAKRPGHESSEVNHE